MSDNGELDKKLSQAFGGERPDETRARSSQKEALAQFDRRIHRVRIAFWIYMALLILFMGVGAINFVQAKSTQGLIGYAILILMMYEGTILMKLWLYVTLSKISVMEELKQLRLDVADLVRRMPAADGEAPARPAVEAAWSEAPRPESPAPSVPRRVWLNWIRRLAMGLAVAGMLAALLFPSQIRRLVSAPSIVEKGVFGSTPLRFDIPETWKEPISAFFSVQMEKGQCKLQALGGGGESFSQEMGGTGHVTAEMPPGSRQLVLDPGANPGAYEIVLRPHGALPVDSGATLLFALSAALATLLLLGRLNRLLLRGQ